MGTLSIKITDPRQIPAKIEEIRNLIERGLKGGTVMVTLGREQRTHEQNDHIHPVIREIQRHLEAAGAPKRGEAWWRYYLLGKWAGTALEPDPVAPESFIVMSKVSGTSELRKDQASEFLEWLYAFGAGIGVEFKEG